jgi:hypothetical protein
LIVLVVDYYTGETWSWYSAVRMTVDTIIFYNNCRDYIVACVDDDDDDDDVATGGAEEVLMMMMMMPLVGGKGFAF